MVLRYVVVANQADPWVMTVSFFFSSRRRHTRFDCDWSSDVCSSDLSLALIAAYTLTLAGCDHCLFHKKHNNGPNWALIAAARQNGAGGGGAGGGGGGRERGGWGKRVDIGGAPFIIKKKRRNKAHPLC